MPESASSRRIKPDGTRNVKTGAAIFAFLALCGGMAFADEKSADVPDKLPDIKAKTYVVKVARKSKSGRVYLFYDSDNAMPGPGRILLLKTDDDPSMAFRVLKNYDDKKQFAAKRVRRYGSIKHLEDRKKFTAVEKLSDYYPPSPPTEEDRADLKELELKILPYDPELDETQDAQGPADDILPKKKTKNSPDHESPLPLNEEEAPPAAVDEIPVLDRHNHWVTAQAGYLRNSSTEDRSPYYTGGGLRYGFTLKRKLLLRKAAPQDSVVVEGGVFIYKILGFVSTGTGSTIDTYTVMPLALTLRYNVFINEDFAVFFYGGILKNRILSSSTGEATAVAALSKTLIAVGGGFLFRIAPSWQLRIDAGYDCIIAGLVLRF